MFMSFNMNLQKKRYNDVALVVSSCDQYSLLLKYFFLQLKKYFPIFDGEIYTTASGDYSYEGYNITGIDQRYSQLSFSTRLILLLKIIKSKYVLFFLDDFLLYSPVNNVIIDDGIKILEKDKGVGMIVLHDSSSYKNVCNNKYNEFFHIKKRISPYKCTTQVSLWDRQFLLKILRKGESPWDFELIGTYRLCHSKRKILYRDDKYNNCFDYPNGGIVIRGKINHNYQPFFSFDLNTIAIKEKPTPNRKKSKLYNRLTMYASFFYPLISRFFPFVSRFGSPYIPKYVSTINILRR